MGVDLTARANLHGQRVDLTWSCETETKQPPRFRLLRRERAYPTMNDPDKMAIEGMIIFDSKDLSSTQESVGEIHTVHNADSDQWLHTFIVSDAPPNFGITYYYALFDNNDEIVGCAVERKSNTYNFSEKLYDLLPAFYRTYDEPTPDQHNQGQLRRFLQVFGLMLDQLRSQAEGLQDRHDVLHARADLLPHLSQWIGWDLDLTQDVMAQRQEILFAPEIYRTVGTLPNLQALVNRATGWDCQVNEFIHNIFLTNAPEIPHLWEIWETRYDKNKKLWTDPTPVTRTEYFDGCPVTVKDATGTIWLYWHSNRRDLREVGYWSPRSAQPKRQIWCQQLDDPHAVPECLQIAPRDDPDDRLEVAESLAVLAVDTGIWLFFDSGELGQRDVWAVNLAGGKTSTGSYLAENLSNHQADDCHPTVVDFKGQIHLFWQSDRRGPTDIWGKVYNGTSWSLPVRITKAQLKHEMPAATVVNQRQIWLFWCENLGDQCQIFYRIFDEDNQQDNKPQLLPEGGISWLNESPTAIFWDNKVWLFWHSNRDGRWQIWGQTYGINWSSPFRVKDHPAAGKEPIAIVDSAGLRLFWRSQRGVARLQSRTVDTRDPEMLARLHTFQDRVHYTYDTGKENQNCYALDTIGIFLTPDREDETLIIRNKRVTNSIVREFLPVNVRAVLIINPPIYKEAIYSNQRAIGERFFDSAIPEAYSGLREEDYWDTVPGWIWIHTWSHKYENHHTVDCSHSPVDTSFRTFHIRIRAGGK